MKHTLFTLLAAFVATPVFAGNLNSSDWTTLCGDHAHNFTFENGNLVAPGGTSCELLYTSTAYKMENGSSLAITLQFEWGVSDSWNSFFIAHRNNEYTHFWEVEMNPNYNGRTSIVEYVTNNDGAYTTLSDVGVTSAILTLNYTVEDGNLYFAYTFNGTSSEKKTVEEGIDTSLAWQPWLAWNSNNTSEFTVTNVNFTAPIPEPATATLSLLALVGLAARRRRATR